MHRIVPKRLLNRISFRFASSSTAETTPPQSKPTLSSSTIDTSAVSATQPRNFANYRQHSTIDGFYWRSPYGSITVPDLTLDQYVWKNLSKWPNKVAIICGVTGRLYTYAQLRDHCAAVAHRLRTDYKLQRSDVIAISMTNQPEYAIAVLGAMEAGLTVTTINPAYTQHEHVKQLVMSNTKLIFGLAQEVDLLRASVAQVAVEQKTAEMPIVTLRTSRAESKPTGVQDFEELMSLRGSGRISSLPPAGHQSSDIALIPFSSGTTGLPKGVQLTHRNIAVNCEMINAPLPDEKLFLPTTREYQDVVPAVLPFFHIYGFTVLLMLQLAHGCRVITLPRFEPLSFINSLKKHKATFVSIVPPLLLFLANDERVKHQHLAHVRFVMCGAAPSGSFEADRIRDQKAPHVRFTQAYGMSEASPAIAISPLPNIIYDSIGFPCPGTEIKIARLQGDDNCKIDLTGVDANVEGEILVRGPQVMHGYLNNPEATAATITPDGWLRTGDVAVYDNDGQIFIRDRVKELIKVNGYPVAPAELEDVLRTHPLVLDAGVIGVKDVRSGEVPRAFVAVRPGVTPEELQAFVAERVTKYKRLTGGVQIIDSVPRSSTGKILRRQLR